VAGADDQPSGSQPRTIDTSVPHPSRVYDYWLGGKDNFAADRQAAQWSAAASAAGMCRARQTVRANRAFLARAVRYLAREAGVRQFLDIGAGLPAAGNTHEIAQREAPQSRVVYVDNDRVVLAHARALLVSAPEGVTDYLNADLREPDTIVRGAAATLDFAQPVALMLLAILQFIPASDEAYQIVSRLLGSVSPGSYMVISHPTGDLRPGDAEEFQRRYNQSVAGKLSLRTKTEILSFFHGLDLVHPGLVQADLWRPDIQGVGRTTTSRIPIYCGVGKKR
jgi:trans-aconitate methyltransferase